VIPLICIDVDGTLVGSSRVVTEGVWHAVDEALARGQHLALSTARGAFASSWEMARRLDPAGWHVFHAGGAIVHTGTGASRGHSLSAEQVEASIDVATKRGWVLELYSANDYAVAIENELSVDHAGLLGVPFVARDLESFILAAGPVVRAQFVVPESSIPDVHQALENVDVSITSATSPIMPGVAFVSATQRGITKATGISQLCDDLGINIDRVMMIGDGLNDLPAITAVGHPVAMANAAPEVRNACRHQVASVEHDGVAEALRLSATL
jgi:Cof subfamily protein (haloacid dehalogenase superfamily)